MLDLYPRLNLIDGKTFNSFIDFKFAKVQFMVASKN